jgi:hypothetical protein
LAAFDRQRDPRQDESWLDSTPRRACVDADFSNRGAPMQPAREPFRKVDQVEEPRRMLGERGTR